MRTQTLFGLPPDGALDNRSVSHTSPSSAPPLKKERSDVEAGEHNSMLTICQDESGVLAAVIEYLRKQSGSLLRRGNGSNVVDLSAVCQDWRRINRMCAEQWLAGLRKHTRFDWQIAHFSHCARLPRARSIHTPRAPGRSPASQPSSTLPFVSTCARQTCAAVYTTRT